MTLEIRETDHGIASVLLLEGALDCHTCTTLVNYLLPEQDLILDLTKVDFIDARGIVALLNVQKDNDASGRATCFIIPQGKEQILKPIRITGLTPTFAIFSTLDECLADLERARL